MALESTVSLASWDVTYPVKDDVSNEYHSVYRPIVFNISNTVAQSSSHTTRRCKIEMLVTGALVGSAIIIDPDLGSDVNFTFDAAPFMRNYLDGKLIPISQGSDTVTTDGDIVKSLRLRFTEIYEDASGNLIEASTEDMGSSNKIVCCNAAYDDYQLGDGVIGSTNNDGVVKGFKRSNAPNKQWLRRGDSAFMGHFRNENNDTSITYQLRVYDATGTAISIDLPVSLYTASGTPYAFQHGVGAANVLADYPSALPSNAAYYTISYAGTGSVGSENSGTYEFWLDDDCDETYERFFFMNQFGFYDSFNFKGAKVRTASSKFERTRMQRTLGRQSDQTTNLTPTIGNIKGISYTAHSGLIKSDELLWLEELVTSPEVYVVRNGNYFPVIIRDSKAVTEDKASGLVTMKITYELTHNNRQRS